MRWSALAIGWLAACGSESLPIVTVDVDSTQVSPAPSSLFLTLTDSGGDTVSFTTSVDGDGVTRIALEPHGKSPAMAALVVTAYADRSVVAESPPEAVDLRKDASLSVVLTN